jgi:hypothetical protein
LFYLTKNLLAAELAQILPHAEYLEVPGRKQKMTTRFKKPVVNHSRVVCRNACPDASIYLTQYEPLLGGIYSIPYTEIFVNTPRQISPAIPEYG